MSNYIASLETFFHVKPISLGSIRKHHIRIGNMLLALAILIVDTYLAP